jgi:hypothetical protein
VSTTAHDGCSVSVIDAGSGTEVKHLADNVYGTETYQVSKTGTFRWRVNDPPCLVATYAGSGSATLLDFGTADQAKTDTVLLDPGSHKSAYLAIDGCGVHVSTFT